MIYSVGEKVTYGIHGVCEITEIREQDFGGKREEYYVLTPLSDERSTVFVPCKNELLCAKIKRILTKDQIFGIIACEPFGDYVQNNTERKRLFSSAFSGGDKVALVNLVKIVCAERERRAQAGKKPSSNDEIFLKDASKLLFEELSYVLDISHDEVLPFILGEIEINS